MTARAWEQHSQEERKILKKLGCYWQTKSLGVEVYIRRPTCIFYLPDVLGCAGKLAWLVGLLELPNYYQAAVWSNCADVYQRTVKGQFGHLWAPKYDAAVARNCLYIGCRRVERLMPQTNSVSLERPNTRLWQTVITGSTLRRTCWIGTLQHWAQTRNWQLVSSISASMKVGLTWL